MWERLKDFLIKAGTVLLRATVVIWFLLVLQSPAPDGGGQLQSILAHIGAFIAPAFSLCGFGDWKRLGLPC